MAGRRPKKKGVLRRSLIAKSEPPTAAPPRRALPALVEAQKNVRLTGLGGIEDLEHELRHGPRRRKSDRGRRSADRFL